VTRQFIIAVDGATLPQRDAFTASLQEMGSVAWWHFLGDLWLITDTQPKKMGPAEWRDAARRYMPAAFVFVQEVGTGLWAIYGPEVGFKWLQDYWGWATRG